MNKSVALDVERIHALMDRRGWGVGELAYQAGISYDTIYKIRRGERPNTSAEIVGKIALALGSTVDYLLGISDSPMAAGIAPKTIEAIEVAGLIDELDKHWRQNALAHVRIVYQASMRTEDIETSRSD